MGKIFRKLKKICKCDLCAGRIGHLGKLHDRTECHVLPVDPNFAIVLYRVLESVLNGLECSGAYYSPEKIRSNLEFYKPYGPIVSLLIYDIQQSTFNYVPDDFLAGNQIPRVTFHARTTFLWMLS